MAYPNAVTAFMFEVSFTDVTGLNSEHLVQEVTLPERGNELIEQGGGNHKFHTVGLATIGECTLKFLVPFDKPDVINNLAARMSNQQNITTNTGSLPSVYFFTVVLRENDPSGSLVNTHTMTRCVAKSLTFSEKGKTKNENAMMTLVFQPNEYNVVSV